MVVVDERLSSSQVGRILEVSSERVRQWIRSGKLPAVETSLGYLVRSEDVDAMRREREARMARHVDD